MRNYKCLSVSKLESNGFHIESLRDEDKYEIMDIRNQQIYHLRQNEPLTKEKQEHYFATVVAGLFEQEKPSQLLFSFFENGNFIGYGGLVHINWVDKNAEISFVMKTELEKDSFAKYWSNYLKLIEKLAFEELNFHKIFTYAFDLRPHLYPVLESCGFKEEARLREHCLFDGQFFDVVYHAKINRKISFRKANENDAKLLFDWANDKDVRINSLNQFPILWENHLQWFESKLNSPNTLIFILERENEPLGQIRFDKVGEFWEIDYSIDKKERGKGYGKIIVKQGLDYFKDGIYKARVKKENISSKKVFLSLGFLSMNLKSDNMDDVELFIYKKN